MNKNNQTQNAHSQHSDSAVPRPKFGISKAESDGWAMISTFLAGPLLWGGIGWGVDKIIAALWLPSYSGKTGLAIGAAIGFIAAFYIVYVRYGRDDSAGKESESVHENIGDAN